MTSRAVTFVVSAPLFMCCVLLGLMTWLSSGGEEGLPDCTGESIVYPLPAVVALAASAGALVISNRVRSWGRPARIVGGLWLLAVLAAAGQIVLADEVRGAGCFGSP